MPTALTPGRHIAVAVQALDRLGGKERDALAIAQGLAARGHHVTVLTRSARLKLPANVRVREIGAGGWTNHGRARRFVQAVAAERHGFDLLLSFDKLREADAYYAADICFACRLRGIKARLPRYATYAKIEADCFGPGGPDILFLCRKQQNEYLRCYQLGPGRAVVLPPMIHDAEAPSFYAHRAAVRQKFSIPESVPLAVSVAVYPRQKGVDRVIAALERIPNLHLLAVGLKEIAPVQTLAAKHDVLARTRLLGHTNEVAQLLGAADIMLHPARIENTGLVILEGLLAGLPVIASGACGFAEYVERFGAGAVLAEPFDAAEFVAAIRAAIEPQRLVELKRRARESAPALRAEGGLERILDVIDETLARRGHARAAPIGALK